MDQKGNNNSSIVACRPENTAPEYYRRNNNSYKDERIISSHPLRMLNPFLTAAHQQSNTHELLRFRKYSKKQTGMYHEK